MLQKKSLGQHFLRNPRILEKIAGAANLSLADTVLEVGPGEGTLTELLLSRAGRVIAVEKDDRLIPVLQQKFTNEIASGRLELIHADILDLTLSYKLKAISYKLVANIPYYITGMLLRKFLESERQPSMMVLLLQKEVAKRIVAADGKAKPNPLDSVAQSSKGRFRESILSISVKAYGAPRYIGTVKAGAFSPPPKVDSAIIAIEEISKKFFIDFDEKKFFEFLKKGFAHPRKLLSSNLEVVQEQLRECGIEEKARPENLSVEQWKCLLLHLKNSSHERSESERH